MKLEGEVSKMKIFGNIQNVYKTNKTDNVDNKKDVNKKDAEKPVTSSVSGDKVEISITGKSKIYDQQEIQLIKQEISKLPDVREDKVADIKSQIKNGTYNVELEKVAKAILESIY